MFADSETVTRTGTGTTGSPITFHVVGGGAGPFGAPVFRADTRLRYTDLAAWTAAWDTVWPTLPADGRILTVDVRYHPLQ